jgi:hypothetical protein
MRRQGGVMPAEARQVPLAEDQACGMMQVTMIRGKI